MTEVTQIGKVAVLMGGTSAERGISLLSGQAVLLSLLKQQVDAHTLDSNHWAEDLIKGKFDRAFIMLHGRGGEDGTIQGVLESLAIPYTGSGVLGSALAMDKRRSKQLWLAQGLPTPKFMVIDAQSDWKQLADLIGFPMAIKPCTEGSSVGISKVNRLEELPEAFNRAVACGAEVIAEQWIVGREVTCALLDDELLPLVEIESAEEFYNFHAKYESDATQYRCPVSLPEALTHSIQHLAAQAFVGLGASGWGRIDFMLDNAQRPWLIEANTVPGMTNHSLVPMAALAAGYDFDQLVMKVLKTSFISQISKEVGQR
jgi:D-alanine-D-alanine ligase